MTHAPRPRRNKEITKAALLEAGAKAFATKGFDGTTLDDIAIEAGVNKAMVAYYFSDKAGLFQAILQDAVDFILQAVDADVDKNAPARDQLSRYITALGQMMARRPAFPAMLLRDYMSGRFQQDDELVSRLMKFSMETKRILELGEINGEFGSVDYHMFHLMIVGSLAYFVASSRFREDMDGRPNAAAGPMPSLNGFVEQLVSTTLDGLTPRG